MSMTLEQASIKLVEDLLAAGSNRATLLLAIEHIRMDRFREWKKDAETLEAMFELMLKTFDEMTKKETP